MTTTPITPIHSTPAESLRAAAATVARIENELAAVRTALAAAEAAVAAALTAGPVTQPDALSMEQVGRALGLSRSTVAEMIRRGEIRSVKIGGSRRVFRADLDAYIAAARGQAS